MDPFFNRESTRRAPAPPKRIYSINCVTEYFMRENYFEKKMITATFIKKTFFFTEIVNLFNVSIQRNVSAKRKIEFNFFLIYLFEFLRRNDNKTVKGKNLYEMGL